MTGSPSYLTDKILIGAGLILILFAICATWSTPFGAGDLYVSLAAGRDVFAGKLNTPDDWSFSTNGRVWLNQNWGADCILYVVASALGGTGLLVVKFVLLILCAFFLMLALHERKIPPAVGLIITAIIMVALNAYVILRPNLFMLPLAALELWLLFKSTKHSAYLWLAVLVILFWANIHGSFIYGVGMLCLWAGCSVLPELWKKKAGVFKQNWQLLAAIAAAIILAGVANPFGLQNLTLPFTMLQGSEWNTTIDWQPLWRTDLLAGFMSSIMIYLGLVGATLLLLGLRLVGTLPGKKNRNAQQQEDLRFVLFEALLAMVTLAMAVLSNRFINLALVVLAPLLAGQLAWVCRIFRFHRLLLSAVLGFVLVYGLIILHDNIRRYAPENPVMNTGTGTLFEKMHFTNKLYDSELINFINTNRISGNVFSPWKWEGYLRWKSPQLKPFIGGRAQQIYSTETYNQYMYVSGYDIPAYRGKAPEEVLNTIDAHYLIVDNSSSAEKVVLTALNGGNWVIVFADTQALLLANMRYQDAAASVNLLTEDKLIFEREATRAMSKAACLLSQPARWQTAVQTEGLLALFKEAWKYEPRWLLSYWLLYNNLGSGTDALRELVRLMEEQLVRLEALSLEGADADLILRCRIYLASALAQYALSQNSPDMVAKRQHSLDTANQLDIALYSKWKTLIMW